MSLSIPHSRLPHNVRLRPDLVVQPQDASRGTWVVKDPIALRFFLFGSDEHFILQRLDGSQSTDQIIDEFDRERAPRRMTSQRLHSFLSALHRNGLACSDAPRQGSLMIDREVKQRFRETLAGWTNLLAIRLPGINPDALLDRLYPAVRWCFSWWALASMVLAWIAAAALVVVEFDALAAQWPRMAEFVSGGNLVWLAVALAATKVIHELAHAFTCKHFGGSCHELGAMLLVFTPCLYCNVTDAWMLRSRWQRIAISAAGIVMELLLASLAIIGWRYTQPGALNSVCLNMIIVCSVGTLLFNGNPLLKYDGYYILSDLVGIPNLWQQSRTYLYGRLSEMLLGRQRPPGEQPAEQRVLLTVYAVASIAYRCFLTMAILLFLYRLLHPSGLDVVLLIVVASIAGQTAVAWATPALRWWANPTRTERLRKIPLAALLVTLVAGLAAIFIVPLPCDVSAPAMLQARAAKRVYVSTPGILTDAVAAWDSVSEGQRLATLENTELRNEVLRIEGDLSRAQARVDTLELRDGGETDVAAQLLIAGEIVADLQHQLRLKQKESQALTLTAPRAGTVIGPPSSPQSKSPDQELPGWDGSPLDPENRGCYLDRGALLCLVGNTQECDAMAFVDESDVPYVRVGQRARIRLEHSLTEFVVGEVVEISELNAETTPVELAVQHDVAVRNDHAEAQAPVRATYQVRVAIEASGVPRLIGARGAAKITVEPQTIATRIARWIDQTVTIDRTP